MSGRSSKSGGTTPSDTATPEVETAPLLPEPAAQPDEGMTTPPPATEAKTGAEAAPSPFARDTDSPDAAATTQADVTEISGPEAIVPEAEVIPEAAPEPILNSAPAQATAPEARPRGPLMPILGGVVAAAMGFGVAQVVPEGWPLATRNVETAAQLQELDGRLDGFAETLHEGRILDRLGALESRPETASGASPEDLATLREEVTALRAELASRPASAAEPADLAPLKAEIEALKAQLASLPQSDPAEIEAMRAAMQAEREASEAHTAALRAEAETTARAALTRGALLRVQAALESGVALDGALADLVAAGIEIPAALQAHQAGVPSLASLQADFPDAARAVLAATHKPAEDAGITNRLGSLFMAQTGMRSLTPQEGTSPDAILSRAEAQLTAGNLDAALTELDALPDEGRAALAPWRKAADARAEGTRALQALAATLDLPKGGN